MTETVGVLRSQGRLEDIDTALVVGALGMARAVDENPANAALWREYRAFELRLRTAGEGASDLDALIAGLSAPVGNPTDGGSLNSR